MVKNLQLDAADLRKIFEHSITVKDISSKFSYCSGDDDSIKIKIKMEKSDFDVMGVQNGESSGYVFRYDLKHIFRNKIFILDGVIDSCQNMLIKFLWLIMEWKKFFLKLDYLI